MIVFVMHIDIQENDAVFILTWYVMGKENQLLGINGVGKFIHLYIAYNKNKLRYFIIS